jgi:hypothetical protein
MTKFNVGDRVVCTDSTVGLDLVEGSEYTILFSGKGYVCVVESGEERWCDLRFELVKPSLRSLYETERDKLTAQQDITTAAWELVVAEKAMEDNARKALIHAKQDLVDHSRDTLKKAYEFYLKISAELDEMLRNEHL